MTANPDDTDQMNNNASIHHDPFIKGLLDRLPEDNRTTFTDEQLLALKVALSGRKWGRHAIDMRGTVGLWRWKYYYVLVCGRERRSLTRRQEQIVRTVNAFFLFCLLSFSTLLGLLLLYLIKSALGIDLFPGFSLGIWDWFKGLMG